MRLRLKRGGDLNLTKRDFLASGGEGSVYVRGDVAYKIYADPRNMIPEAKIGELAAISSSNVIKPEDVILAGKKPVGYTMRYVRNTYSLCQLFPKAFKDRNRISPETILYLVEKMRDGVLNVHSGGVLIVDLNEMNFLVDRRFGEVYFIDVDSYQTRSFPATALMDSVKDWKAGGRWTELSDWFSWGCVTFQLFTGIHPFKGKHPVVKGMTERMQQGISVFNKDVKVPRMVPSFDTVPQAYRDWYRAVFEDGKRVAPPTGPVDIVQLVTVRKISGSDNFDIVELYSVDSPVASFANICGKDVILGGNGCHVGHRGKTSNYQTGTGGTGHICKSDNDRPLLAMFHNGYISFEDVVTGAVVGGLHGREIMNYDGRVYVRSSNGDQVYEVTVGMFAGGPSCEVVASVMPNATKFYDGVAVQNMLGSWYATIFPVSGRSYQAHLSELKGFRIVDAKYDSRVLMVVGERGGKYSKFVYRFERFGNVANIEPELFWRDDDIPYSGLNFVVLDNGLCAHIDESEDLLLFAVSLSSTDVKKIQDPVLSGDMRLYKRGAEVLFGRGNKIFKLSMRK